MLLNRDMLLIKEPLKIEKVQLTKEDFVFVRQMTAREKDRFEQSLSEEILDDQGSLVGYKRSLDDFRAKLAVNVLCDEEGVNLLKPDDYPVLSQNMSAARLEKIVNAAQKLNKITEADRQALIKN